MKFLVVMFISPLYFAMRRKWGAFVFSMLLYLFAVATVIFTIGIFFWMVGVLHAAWHLRTELMEEQAQIMAKKLAEEMRRPVPTERAAPQ